MPASAHRSLIVRPGQADMQTDLRTDRLQQRRDGNELAGPGTDSSHPAVTGMPGWQGWLRPRVRVSSFNPVHVRMRPGLRRAGLPRQSPPQRPASGAAERRRLRR